MSDKTLIVRVSEELHRAFKVKCAQEGQNMNRVLSALIQANRRGIPLGPIASFNRWKELGRYVKKGQKAIELCMPITMKRTVKEQGTDGNDVETDITFKRFAFRRNWFMLSQTEGAEY